LSNPRARITAPLSATSRSLYAARCSTEVDDITGRRPTPPRA